MGAGIESRIAELLKRHEACDTEIKDLGRFPCSIKLKLIKFRKLRLKRLIHRLQKKLEREPRKTPVESARHQSSQSSTSAVRMAAE